MSADRERRELAPARAGQLAGRSHGDVAPTVAKGDFVWKLVLRRGPRLATGHPSSTTFPQIAGAAYR